MQHRRTPQTQHRPPQRCVLSPLLCILYTHDCIPVHSSNSIIKFAYDTTVVGRISGGDESANQDEVEWMSESCTYKNLVLNITKTKKLIVDFRSKKTDIQALFIGQNWVKNQDVLEY